MVNSVLELPTLGDLQSLSTNQILDTIQDLPDDVWFSISEQLAADKISSPDVAEAAYTRLAVLADQHEILKTCPTYQLDLPPPTFKSVLVTKSTNMSSMNLSEIKKYINERVKDLIHSGSTNFEGIMIDNGDAKSPFGINVFIRYCAHTAIVPTITKSQQDFRGFGNGIVKSLGNAVIRIPLGVLLTIEFSVDLKENDVLIIFGLEHHRSLNRSSNEVDKTFTHHHSQTTVPVIFREDSPSQGGHLYLNWAINDVLYTKSELKKLHQSFGHPSSKSLIKLLQKAFKSELSKSVIEKLEKITERCNICRTWKSEPVRFRVTILSDEKLFNHEIEVDLMWIEGDPVLYIIYRGTRYSVCEFMREKSSEYAWSLIIECWITVFTGYPYIISHDQGPQFSAKYFQVACSQNGIISKGTLTQSHNSLGLCERYHSIIRQVYNKLKEEDPSQDEHTRLSLAVHAVNNTTGPGGLNPTILVYGSVPQLPLTDTDTLLPTEKSCVEAMRVARKEMETTTAQRRIESALKYRHKIRPFPSFQFGDKVRIWREDEKKFVCSYVVHAYDNEKHCICRDR